MTRLLGVLSGKGGTGKTTFTMGLAGALAKAGETVVVVDGNIGFGNCDIYFGLESRVLYNWMDVLKEKISLEETLLYHPGGLSLALLPPPPIQGEEDAFSFKSIIVELKTPNTNLSLHFL